MFDGFPSELFVPFIKQFKELFALHLTLVDNYESFYKYLGITRPEMMELMKGVAGVDILSGIDNLEYME